MAFGGVATGSMNANDVAMAHGSMRYNGFSCNRSACNKKKRQQLHVNKHYDCKKYFQFWTGRNKP